MGPSVEAPFTALFTVRNASSKPVEEVVVTLGGDGVMPEERRMDVPAERSVVYRRRYPSGLRSAFVSVRTPGLGEAVAVTAGERAPPKPPNQAAVVAISGGIAIVSGALIALMTHLFTADRERKRRESELAEADHKERVEWGQKLYEHHRQALDEFARLWDGTPSGVALEPAVAELQGVPFQQLKAEAAATLLVFADPAASEEARAKAAKALAATYDEVVKAPWSGTT